MNPRIEAKSVSEDGDVLKFTLSGVNVSIANSIRRTICPLFTIRCSIILFIYCRFYYKFAWTNAA